MIRPRLLVAFVRVLIVAVSLCLFGAARSHHQGSTATIGVVGPAAAHADPVDLPDLGDALTEQRAIDDRDSRDSGDSDTRPPPRASFLAGSNSVLRAIMARGPPVDPQPVEGRPRSSRGPPAQV